MWGKGRARGVGEGGWEVGMEDGVGGEERDECVFVREKKLEGREGVNVLNWREERGLMC